MTCPRNIHGFTLIEAMLAVAVLMLGVLALEKNIVAQVMGNNSSKLVTTGTAAASSWLETLQSLTLDADTLTDAAGLDHNNLLQANPTALACANLDNTINGSTVLADHAVNWDASGGRHIFASGDNLTRRGIVTVFWNVCDNPDAAGSRLIRVISRWRDNNHADNVDDGDTDTQQTVVNYVKSNL
ncbi:MAG: prepilin-type N-terminal cleavage/methylation domain-containing protein [Desulfobulbaceae bacterium]|jgi:hypothetical protein|nr:prepilin-type N-terminal cleavage/methylation domain-containing protein [Desulfobulbaceae bacterium]